MLLASMLLFNSPWLNILDYIIFIDITRITTVLCSNTIRLFALEEGSFYLAAVIKESATRDAVRRLVLILIYGSASLFI